MTKPPVGRRRSIGLASGALWLVAISAVFMTWSLVAIRTPMATQVLIGALVVVVALIATSVVVLRAALQLPDGIPPRTPDDDNVGRRFAWVVGAEVVAFAVVNAVAGATRSFSLMPSLNLIIVGLHFLPLAWMFRVPRYYVMGLLFCAIPMVTLLAMPSESLVGHAPSWYVVPSLGCGLVASLTAAAGLREAWQSVAGSRAA